MKKEGDRPREKAILPQDLLDHYVGARKNTYAWMPSSSAAPDLSAPGSEGFEYPEAIKPGYLLPYRYRDEWVNGKEKGSFAGRETNFSIYNESDLITLYSYMGGLTEEGMEQGEDFVYGLLLRGFLRNYANQVRLGENVQFEHQIEQGNAVYKGEGARVGTFWHDKETIELNGMLLYIGRGDGGYNPAARGKAIAQYRKYG